ncbi:MAG: hypothetical protein EA376_07460 [Phycisphaeraceae bacterium]|nr:MAG: hypothetical protein EA376_07460 [Phycisphaeraceae bacterium]
MKRAPLIPSMFHRRLALLLVFAGLAAIALISQLMRLTVVEGAERRRVAESRLVTERWTPTFRGRILDRRGRVLAVDRPSFDVAFDYRVITGVWAYSEAAAHARRDHQDDWVQLSAIERDALIERYLTLYEARLNEMWELVAEMARIDRAEIEERKSRVVERVQRMASAVWDRRLEQERVRQMETAVDVTIPRRPIREQRQPHVLLRNVDDRIAFRLRSLSESLPGIVVTDASEREYPHETMEALLDRTTLPSPMRGDGFTAYPVQGVATHILGWMRTGVQRDDIEGRPRIDPLTGEVDRGHYQIGDTVGSAGVELTYERRLRGLRGRTVEHLDTGEREIIDATPGEDIALTIDIELQAKTQAIIDPAFGLTTVQDWHDPVQRDPEDGRPTLAPGSPLNSAVVVIDIETGDILAMASHPTFTRRQMREDPSSIFEDEATHRWVNRAIARPYQPGSIVKPIMLVEAVSRGLHTLDRGIECNGHFLPNRADILRCWIYRERFGLATHTQQVGGPLFAPEALARSCNIYFYTLGRLLGVRGVEDVYRRYGLGRAIETGLGASTGDSPSPTGAVRGFLGHLGSDMALTSTDAIMMGIGQGPVSWTPLHAADAYATLARHGVQLEPRVVADLEREPRDFRLDGRAIEESLEGLRLGVIADVGTANYLNISGRREPIFNAPGVDVLAKTGTAQAGPGSVEHAWTVALVGPKGGPLRYSIAVVVEHAGSGGRVAGPVTNQIVHALISEGYLGGGAP